VKIIELLWWNFKYIQSFIKIIRVIFEIKKKIEIFIQLWYSIFLKLNCFEQIVIWNIYVEFMWRKIKNRNVKLQNFLATTYIRTSCMGMLLIYFNLKKFILCVRKREREREREVFFQNIAIIYILVIGNITIFWKWNYRYFGSLIVKILCRLPFCCPIWRTTRNQESLRLEAIIVHDVCV